MAQDFLQLFTECVAANAHKDDLNLNRLTYDISSENSPKENRKKKVLKKTKKGEVCQSECHYYGGGLSATKIRSIK